MQNKKYSVKWLFISLSTCIMAVLTVFMFGFDRRVKKEFYCNGQSYRTSAKSMTEACELASRFGRILQGTAKTENIRIPMQFHDVYQQYNALQKEIGMDLEPYKGEACILYSFDTEDDKTLHLIVFHGYCIGGDISEKEFDGEMRSLAGK